MSKYSDQRLGKDIIEAYQKYRQDKGSYKKLALKDKNGTKFEFTVPKKY
jgi:hypothetical protein